MDVVILTLALMAFGQATPAVPNKAEVVGVMGCLRETSPDTWLLTNASDPVSSNANTPSAKELASFPKGGKNQFRLTGVTVFNLPVHRGHTVLVKGLLNKASPVSRLNVTSVTMVSAECPPK